VIGAEVIASPVEPTLDNPFGLTAKELLFVAAYVGDAQFNATKALRRSGLRARPRQRQ
jgi:hypothetical protein